MPRMFRSMRKDADGFPIVGQSTSALGVRPGVDIQGNAVPNDKGMSVSPSWRTMSVFFIPKRLGHGGRGSNNRYCFRRGSRPFQQTKFGNGLEFVPDSDSHGVVRPAELMPFAQFEENLAATRSDWVIDEN